MSELLARINEAVKESMRNRDQRRLGVLRLITSSIKQQEIANRTENSREPLNNTEILVVLERMIKQRVDAREQFIQASRDDLAAQEAYEIEIIREFMPLPLTQQDLENLIEQAFQVVQPKVASDMGKIISYLKPQLQGRADMKTVSEIVKNKLSLL